MQKLKHVLLIILSFIFMLPSIYGNEYSTYPEKDITMIVPFNAGGGIDISSRTLVKELEEYFPDISFIVKNVTGSSGAIGAEELFNAKPDGYTLMAAGNGFNVSSEMGIFKRSAMDYEMAGQYTTSQIGLYVRADSPYQTYEDLIEAARNNPNEIVMGILTATMNHYAILAIEHAENVSFKKVIVGGDQPPQPELLSGRVDTYVVAVSQNTQYIDSGDFRCLGVFAEERVKSMPDVPTFEELGIEESYELTFGIWAPPGTPKEILEIISDAIKKVTEDVDFQNTMTAMGYLTSHIGPDEYQKVMEDSLNAIKELSATIATDVNAGSIDPYVGAYGIPNFILMAIAALLALKAVIALGINKQKINIVLVGILKGRALVFLVSLIIYVSVLEILGFIIATAIFLTATIIYLRCSSEMVPKKFYIQTVIFSTVLSILIFLFFTQLASIVLPVGFLGI